MLELLNDKESQGCKRKNIETEICNAMEKYSQMKIYHNVIWIQVYMYTFM